MIRQAEVRELKAREKISKAISVLTPLDNLSLSPTNVAQPTIVEENIRAEKDEIKTEKMNTVDPLATHLISQLDM